MKSLLSFLGMLQTFVALFTNTSGWGHFALFWLVGKSLGVAPIGRCHGVWVWWGSSLVGAGTAFNSSCLMWGSCRWDVSMVSFHKRALTFRRVTDGAQIQAEWGILGRFLIFIMALVAKATCENAVFRVRGAICSGHALCWRRGVWIHWPVNCRRNILVCWYSEICTRKVL